jgi:hypothetical protein
MKNFVGDTGFLTRSQTTITIEFNGLLFLALVSWINTILTPYFRWLCFRTMWIIL